ncbi:MAG TPA: ribosome biogenesis GTPase Der [Gammaproteobacteria bacterium]|nr:ribosome biogenesis GTPase Der [Gammaproteobacteria bacterium]
MLPAVALVGRPNVGKSTLFNVLTRSRDALVADIPGVTRDRRYGIAKRAGRSFVVIDTGGLGAEAPGGLQALVERQVEYAVDEADAVVLVVDYRDGLTAEDERIAERLRRTGKPVTVAVNKAEGVEPEAAAADFHRLGFGAPRRIAALHGQGVDDLVEQVLEPFGAASEEPGVDEDAGPKIAVIGRPNVGKSTLINRLIGTERLVTSPEPGTTRDSVLVPCERDGRRFVLIDTAGIRRRARISETLEKYSVVQSLTAIEEAGVVIALLDAREGVTEQDLHLVGLAVERGRALVIGVNKWDGLASAERKRTEAEVGRRLDFVPFADVVYVSALHGSNIAELVRSALDAYESASAELPTPRLNEVLQAAVSEHAPPIVRGRRIRLRYAHQGGRRPPIIVVHGSQAERVPGHYRRYLENAFREAFGLRGTPIRLELKSGENPYAGKRNVLTPRQQARRRRLIRHAKRKR